VVVERGEPGAEWRLLRRETYYAGGTRSSWLRLNRLRLNILNVLNIHVPDTIALEDARGWFAQKGSVKSSIGTGRYHGAILCAVGEFVVGHPDCAVLIVPPPRVTRWGRAVTGLPTKGLARAKCRAWFGDVDAWTEHECDAAVLAILRTTAGEVPKGRAR